MPLARPMATPMCGPLSMPISQMLSPTNSQNITQPPLLQINQLNSEITIQCLMPKDIQNLKEGSSKSNINRFNLSANKENIISLSPENKAIPNIQNQIIHEYLEIKKELPLSNNSKDEGQNSRNYDNAQSSKEQKDLHIFYEMKNDFPLTTKTIPELKLKDLKDLYEIQELHENNDILNAENSNHKKSDVQILKPEIKSKDFDKFSEKELCSNNSLKKQNIQRSDLNVLINECSFRPQISRLPDKTNREYIKNQKYHYDLEIQKNKQCRKKEENNQS